MKLKPVLINLNIHTADVLDALCKRGEKSKFVESCLYLHPTFVRLARKAGISQQPKRRKPGNPLMGRPGYNPRWSNRHKSEDDS